MQKSLLKTCGALTLSAYLSGCALESNRIQDLRPIFKSLDVQDDNSLDKEKNKEVMKHENLEQLLEAYFVPETAGKLKKVPLIHGVILEDTTGYTLGVNFWGEIASLLTFRKTGYTIVIAKPLKNPKELCKTIIHEYIHVAEHMGYIDIKEFEINYERFRADVKKYTEIEKTDQYNNELSGFLISAKRSPVEIATLSKCRELIDRIESWKSSILISIFGISKTRERIAYLGSEIALGEPCPPYIRKVYRNMLRFDDE